jgi:hypothetical protein
MAMTAKIALPNILPLLHFARKVYVLDWRLRELS